MLVVVVVVCIGVVRETLSAAVLKKGASDLSTKYSWADLNSESDASSTEAESMETSVACSINDVEYVNDKIWYNFIVPLYVNSPEFNKFDIQSVSKRNENIMITSASPNALNYFNMECINDYSILYQIPFEIARTSLYISTYSFSENDLYLWMTKIEKCLKNLKNPILIPNPTKNDIQLFMHPKFLIQNWSNYIQPSIQIALINKALSIYYKLGLQDEMDKLFKSMIDISLIPNTATIQLMFNSIILINDSNQRLNVFKEFYNLLNRLQISKTTEIYYVIFSSFIYLLPTCETQELANTLITEAINMKTLNFSLVQKIVKIFAALRMKLTKEHWNQLKIV